jgi:thiamine biosynthesis lipoprotein
MLHEHRFRAMNTDVGVWLWSTAPERAVIVGRSLEWAEAFFGRVEQELSRFRSASGVSRLNQAGGRGPQPVSPLLWTVLMSALEAADDSGGIYDPTLLRNLERIGYDRSFEAIGGRSTAEAITDVPSFGSWRRVRSDRAARSVSLPPDLALDFGGIAKGWTVDRVALALAPLGPVLVDAGGDLRVIGTVDGEDWPIAVQNPFEPERDRAIVRLSDGGLATSSIGGRRWQRGDRTLHHVIDPRTGTAAQSDLHSVTVRAPTAMMADVAAKVVLVLGSASGTTYLLERGLSGLLTSVHRHETLVGNFRWEEMERHASVHCA